MIERIRASTYDVLGNETSRTDAEGNTTRFVYDAALVAAAGRVDRIWLGSEAIGQETFVGRIGTRALLERARHLDVPVAILATTDKLVPGPLRLPEWPADSERDADRLAQELHERCAPLGVVDEVLHEVIRGDLLLGQARGCDEVNALEIVDERMVGVEALGRTDE